MQDKLSVGVELDWRPPGEYDAALQICRHWSVVTPVGLGTGAAGPVADAVTKPVALQLDSKSN